MSLKKQIVKICLEDCETSIRNSIKKVNKFLEEKSSPWNTVKLVIDNTDTKACLIKLPFSVLVDKEYLLVIKDGDGLFHYWGFDGEYVGWSLVFKEFFKNNRLVGFEESIVKDYLTN